MGTIVNFPPFGEVLLIQDGNKFIFEQMHQEGKPTIRMKVTSIKNNTVTIEPIDPEQLPPLHYIKMG